MRFVFALALCVISAQPALALTCAKFEEIALQSKSNDELARRYFGGWLEGLGSAVLTSAALNQRAGTKGTYCFALENHPPFTNADLVGLYDNGIATWPAVDKSDPGKCLAEAIILLEIEKKFPCR